VGFYFEFECILSIFTRFAAAKAVQATHADIDLLKTQLSEARQRRSNLLQYEGLAKNVNKYPDRPQLRKRQRDAEQQLQAAEAEAAEVEGKLHSRRQQFALLMSTITDLESMFSLEDSQAAGAAAASGSQQIAEEGELPEASPAAQGSSSNGDSDGDMDLK